MKKDIERPTLAARDLRRAELKHVIAMAIPMVVTTSSRALMDIADYVMITRLDLDAAQAAILPAQMIMWSYIVVGLGIVSVVNTFASQCLGKKQYRDCSAYAWQGVYFAVLIGVVGLALRPLLPALINWIGHDADVRVMEISYARVALLTPFPTLAAASLAWFFTGIHKPSVAMWSALEANVVNIVVSAVLIFGFGSIEPMGIEGAAWGTLAGVCYRMVRLTVSLLSKKINQRYHSRSTWRLCWSKTLDLLRVGLPCGCHWVSEVVVWSLFVTVLIGTKFGMADLIATNTAWQYMRLAFMPTVGVGQALTALVGKSIGSGHPERAIRETRIAAWITIAYMGSLSVVYFFAGRYLIGLFNDQPEVIALGGRIMICAAIFQLFDAIGISYNSALRGAGDTFVPSAFFVVSTWVIIIGGGWTAATLLPEWQSLGPWIAASCFIIITSLFLWWRWHSRVWMKIHLIPPDDTDISATASPAAVPST